MVNLPLSITLLAAFNPTEIGSQPEIPAGTTAAPVAGMQPIMLGVIAIMAAGIVWAFFFRSRPQGVSTTIEGAARSVTRRRRSRARKRRSRPVSESGGLPPVRTPNSSDSPPYGTAD